MEEWGSLLIKFYNKNTKLKDDDYMINYLSYWTDNGKKLYKFQKTPLLLPRDGPFFNSNFLNELIFSLYLNLQSSNKGTVNFRLVSQRFSLFSHAD